MTTPDIRILSGHATQEEIAAVTAVLTAALGGLASESRRSSATGPTAWQQSQRKMRKPLPRGAWRNLEP